MFPTPLSSLFLYHAAQHISWPMFLPGTISSPVPSHSGFLPFNTFWHLPVCCQENKPLFLSPYYIQMLEECQPSLPEHTFVIPVWTTVSLSQQLWSSPWGLRTSIFSESLPCHTSRSPFTHLCSGTLCAAWPSSCLWSCSPWPCLPGKQGLPRTVSFLHV